LNHHTSHNSSSWYLSDFAGRDLEPADESYIGIFDLFFERNGLGMIVNILTGDMFRLTPLSAKVDAVAFSQSRNADNANSETCGIDQYQEANGSQEDSSNIDSRDDVDNNACYEAKETCTLLPTLKVATQAVQSVSILVQNVSRATSLYFVLSNNYINNLIDLRLDLYSAAEQGRLARNGKTSVATSQSSSPELAELVTHFVTFLKSLAMRMNTETLQFYLKYPHPKSFTGEGESASEETKARSIEFPLYARALDFCAAHHDSFVRVTAMTVCLNTLRLTTVASSAGDDNRAGAKTAPLGSSPDGVLHNANPLPFRDRLAIATHTCAPSRVSRLAAPIFSKLSSLWCSLQESFLDLDTPVPEEETERPKRGPKMDPDKELERKRNAFKEAAAGLEDQLSLLDDVLKVRFDCLLRTRYLCVDFA